MKVYQLNLIPTIGFCYRLNILLSIYILTSANHDPSHVIQVTSPPWTFVNEFYQEKAQLRPSRTQRTGAEFDSFDQIFFQIIGLEDRVERRTRHLSAPQFMVDLYKTLANVESGQILREKPFGAETIVAVQRSDIHKGHLRFHFNLTSIKLLKENALIRAEFHISKLRPSRKIANQLKSKNPLMEVQIHSLVGSNVNGPRKLLDSRRVSLNSVGWEMFDVGEAVKHWLEKPSSNHGLILTSKSYSGVNQDEHLLKWINGYHHFLNKRPILVLYISSTAQKKDAKVNFNRFDPDNKISQLLLKYGQPMSVGRLTESTKLAKHLSKEKIPFTTIGNNSHSSCSRVDYVIDLNELGWSFFVIYPRNLNINGCQGSCSGKIFNGNSNVSKHAAIQGLIRLHSKDSQAFVDTKVNSVSCVPSSLSSIDIMYFTKDGNTVIKKIDGLIATKCGCR